MGLFIYMLILVEPVILAPLQKAVSAVAGMFGDMTGIYESYFNKNVIFISTGDTNLSMYIDYECSGIIEILAFLALLWFFPLYHTYEKSVLSVVGGFAIFVSNVLRIFVICLIIYMFGESSYFIAHTIIGRLVFYAYKIAATRFELPSTLYSSPFSVIALLLAKYASAEKVLRYTSSTCSGVSPSAVLSR